MKSLKILVVLFSMVTGSIAQSRVVDVEQKKQGTRPAAVLAESFDGLGVGFTGPQGISVVRNPSDNSL